MTPRCTCLDASIRRTCCYNFHHYAAHTCRRLTLLCAGTANSLLCTPAITWPPRQLLALLPHVSMFHLNNPYTYRFRNVTVLCCLFSHQNQSVGSTMNFLQFMLLNLHAENTLTQFLNKKYALFIAIFHYGC
jgi:hypothetical protein